MGVYEDPASQRPNELYVISESKIAIWSSVVGISPRPSSERKPYSQVCIFHFLHCSLSVSLSIKSFTVKIILMAVSTGEPSFCLGTNLSGIFQKRSLFRFANVQLFNH